MFGQRFDPAGLPAGAEFQIPSYTTFDQRAPAVAMDASGNFVVVWNRNNYDGSDSDVYGQRFDSTGSPAGSEFMINSYTTGRQSYPAVAANAAGDFVVVWSSYGQDGSYSGVFGQRFDSDGVSLGSEFRVNTYTLFQQRSPAVAADETGEFVVVWGSWHQDGSGDGVFGQRFDSTGRPMGSEFQVNSSTEED